MSRFLGKPLSDREKQVMDLLCSGESITSTSKLLSLSTNTISTYLIRIKLKLGAKSTTHAAAIYAKAATGAPD